VGDAAVVRRRQAGRDLAAVLGRFGQRQVAGSDNRVQRLTLEELGDHKGPTLMLTQVVDVEDVGMVQGCSCASLAFESPQTVAVVGEGFREDLDRDIPFESFIVGAIDLTHSSGSEESADLVSREAITDR